jgi:hypothetical protein
MLAVANRDRNVERVEGGLADTPVTVRERDEHTASSRVRVHEETQPVDS